MSYQQVSKVKNNKEVAYFSNALIQVGPITPKEDLSPSIEPYNPPKHLSKSGLDVVVESEKTNILNHNQIAHFNSGF